MTLIEMLFVACPLIGFCWGIKAGWSHGIVGVFIGALGGAIAGLVFWGVLMFAIIVAQFVKTLDRLFLC